MSENNAVGSICPFQYLFSSLVNKTLIKNASVNKELHFKFCWLLDFKKLLMIIYLEISA